MSRHDIFNYMDTMVTFCTYDHMISQHADNSTDLNESGGCQFQSVPSTNMQISKIPQQSQHN